MEKRREQKQKINTSLLCMRGKITKDLTIRGDQQLALECHHIAVGGHLVVVVIIVVGVVGFTLVW